MATDRDLARFWSKVPHRPEAPDACWHWAGTRAASGYGVFYVSGRLVGAHRFAAGLLDAPRGVLALRACDNRQCVRPLHLRPGSHKENHEDAVARCRATPPPNLLGRTTRRRRVSDEEVATIKNSVRAGVPPREIAEAFRLHVGTIHKIARGDLFGERNGS